MTENSKELPTPAPAGPLPPVPSATPVSAEKPPAPDAWQMAQDGWAELVAAAAKVQRAADLLKQTKFSIHAYNIERALNKHKPPLMEEHYQSLKDFRRENKV